MSQRSQFFLQFGDDFFVLGVVVPVVQFMRIVFQIVEFPGMRCFRFDTVILAGPIVLVKL